MKKILILFVLLISISSVQAQENIFEYLEEIVNEGNYVIVLGDEAPGSDSLAAIAIVSGIQTYSNRGVTLEAILASETSSTSNLILIGHPCDNNLIDLSCSEWPYKEGETLIKIDDGNIILAGTSPEDTRRTAKKIANYRDYGILKESDQIIDTLSGFEVTEIDIPVKGNETQIICGDGICDPTERLSCLEDCLPEEVEEPEPELFEEEVIEEEMPEEKSFFGKFWDWVKGVFS